MEPWPEAALHWPPVCNESFKKLVFRLNWHFVLLPLPLLMQLDSPALDALQSVSLQIS
jgi:hypothetical protein